jgi:hypothetical protein
MSSEKMESGQQLNTAGLAAFVADLQNTPGYHQHPDLQTYFESNVLPRIREGRELGQDAVYAIIEEIYRRIRKSSGCAGARDGVLS